MPTARPRSLSLSNATTRALKTGHRRSSALLMTDGEVVVSADSGRRYRLGRFIGEGGFGQVFRATVMGQAPGIPAEVCVKVSGQMDAWIREAYFGQLLEGHPRAVQVYDRFALVTAGRDPLYCLVLEYASHGDLSTYLARSGQPWPEARTRREIAGVLEVLGKLHRGQLLHRDLTPLNVFVCDGLTLKLGDFGIVRQQTDRRGITARTMNTLTAPSDIIDGRVPKWQARDDVYQVGQLLAMLVRGHAGSRIQPSDVRTLACSDHLKEIIYRCIGERRKRYESAVEFIEALRRRPARLTVGRVRTLKGVHLAFTGVLTRPRAEAARAAKRAGAIVHGGPSSLTSVIVRGAPNPRQAAGNDGGLKLMEIKRLAEKGHRVVVLDERQFWRLVARK